MEGVALKAYDTQTTRASHMEFDSKYLEATQRLARWMDGVLFEYKLMNEMPVLKSGW